MQMTPQIPNIVPVFKIETRKEIKAASYVSFIRGAKAFLEPTQHVSACILFKKIESDGYSLLYTSLGEQVFSIEDAEESKCLENG